MIRARRAYDDMVADPDRFRPAAQALVAEARTARQPEALALALRALAWAERARLDDRSAIRLLNEACRIARRHHLDDALADLLMSHAAVSQELGRMEAARRDLRAAAALLTGPQSANWTSSRPSCCRTSGGWPMPRPSTTGCCPTRRPARSWWSVRQQPRTDRVAAGQLRHCPAPARPGPAGGRGDRPGAFRDADREPGVGHRALGAFRRRAWPCSRRPRRRTGRRACRLASITSSTPTR